MGEAEVCLSIAAPRPPEYGSESGMVREIGVERSSMGSAAPVASLSVKLCTRESRLAEVAFERPSSLEEEGLMEAFWEIGLLPHCTTVRSMKASLESLERSARISLGMEAEALREKLALLVVELAELRQAARGEESERFKLVEEESRRKLETVTADPQ